MTRAAGCRPFKAGRNFAQKPLDMRPPAPRSRRVGRRSLPGSVGGARAPDRRASARRRARPARPPLQSLRGRRHARRPPRIRRPPASTPSAASARWRARSSGSETTWRARVHGLASPQRRLLVAGGGQQRMREANTRASSWTITLVGGELESLESLLAIAVGRGHDLCCGPAKSSDVQEDLACLRQADDPGAYRAGCSGLREAAGPDPGEVACAARARGRAPARRTRCLRSPRPLGRARVWAVRSRAGP